MQDRVSVSFTVNASDLELIFHRPLLEFHTPESSHDPGLAAQERPRPQESEIVFHMGHTYLIWAGEKFIHTSAHTLDGCTFTKVLSFSLFCSLALTLKHTHTLPEAHIHNIPRNPQRGKDGLARGGLKKKVAFIVFRPFISSRLAEGDAKRGCSLWGVPFAWLWRPLPPSNILNMQEFLAMQRPNRATFSISITPFGASKQTHITHMHRFPELFHEATFQ